VRVGLEHIPEPYREVVRLLLEKLLQVLGDRLVSLAVYGSVARGTPRRDSDLDLLVVVRDLPRSITERIRLFEQAEDMIQDLLDRPFDQGYYIALSPVILTPEEVRRIPPILLDMTEDAVIVYDKDNFLKSVLEYLKEKLRELGAYRVWIGKKWYWVLKRDYKFGEVIKIE